MKSLTIFDLDGTLYTFDNSGSVNFNTSRFYENIKENAYQYLSRKFKVSIEEAKKLYQEVKEEFDGEVSLGLESKFGIDRYEWFGNTWNLEPSKFIGKSNRKPLLDSLDSEIAILTAAPRVWASQTLDYLNLNEYQDKLFTGEPDLRKPNPLIFKKICDEFEIPPEQSFSIGDQVYSDIIPAKSIGMKTVLIRSYSKDADYCIDSLDELPSIINEK